MQGAIVTMTKCLAKELVKSRGIRVNSGTLRAICAKRSQHVACTASRVMFPSLAGVVLQP